MCFYLCDRYLLMINSYSHRPSVLVRLWSSGCINKGVNTSRPNKGSVVVVGGGASLAEMVENWCILFPPSACSTSTFADTTAVSVRVAVGVRGAGSEWHGVAALATAQWPTKCKPSPQCEALLCCHRRQSPAGAGERRCGGRQGSSALRGCSLLSGGRQRSV